MNPNVKGGKFERDTARQLSLWLSRGARDDLLWRSSMSGGRATLQFNKDSTRNLTQSGDLSAIGQDAYDFCLRTFIECKHRRDLRLDRSFVTKTGDLYTFWVVAMREAAKYDKRPLLIARQNRFPTLALVRPGDGIFTQVPMITLDHWPALVYLFDEAVRVKQTFTRGDGKAVRRESTGKHEQESVRSCTAGC